MFRDSCQGAVLECDYGDGASVLEQPEKAKQKGLRFSATAKIRPGKTRAIFQGSPDC